MVKTNNNTLVIEEFNSLLELVEYFNDEDTCVKYLAVKRWGYQSVPTPY
jgi:hypothetical protein